MIKNTLSKAVTLACGLTLVGLVGCGESETAQTYIDKAKQSQSENLSGESIIALKNAIKIDPKNAEARFLLGKIYLAQGNAVNAIKELEKAKLHKYSSDENIALLARAYYLNEQNEEIVELASDINTITQETVIKYWLFNTIAQLKLENLEEAKQSLKKANAIDMTSGYSILAKAFIAFYEQDLELAENLVNEVLVKQPNDPEALMLLGNVAGVMEKFSIASDSYRKYLDIQPEQRTAELLLANALLQDGKLSEAEQRADNILALIPTQPYANYVKAMVRAQEEDYENASKHAELAIQNQFNQPNLKLVAGASAFYLKNYEQVLLHLKPLLPYLPEDHFARRMIVVSQLELGIVEDVVETLGDTALEQNSEFNAMLSYKLLQAGAQDEAKAVLNSAQDSQTIENDPTALMRDGVLKLMTNDDSAVKSLEKAVELDPELTKAELALAYIALNKGEYEKAIAIARKWQSKYPEKADGLNLESAIALKQENTKLAKAVLKQALSVEQNNVYTLQQLARIALFEKDTENAISFIDKAIAVAPYDPKVLRQLYDIKRDEQALADIKRKVADKPDDQNLLLIYAEALMKSDKVDEAMRELNTIVPDNKTPKFYWQLKLAGYRSQQNINLVQSALEDWRKLNPYHIEPVVYLADIYVIKQDFDAALRTVNAGLNQHKDNLTLQLVKLQVLLSAQKVTDAEIVYAKLADKIENPTIKQSIEGRIALLNKDYALATELLSPFYQQAPTVKNAIYLVAALVGNEQRHSAIKVIENHPNATSNAQLLTLLGSLYLEVGDKQKAVQVYDNIAEQNPNNIVALNNSAWLYMEQGDFDKAMNFAEKAIAKAPQVANVVDTYSQILLRSGDSRQALNQSKKAYELSLGKDIDIALNYVEVLLSNKRNNEASKVLSTLNQLKNLTDTQANKKAKFAAQIKS